MKEHKMKTAAMELMKRLKDIDLEKVSAITIGIQMKKEDEDGDAEEDYEEGEETEEA